MNKLMVKFGNGIDGIVFELLGARAPIGDSISDANAISSGSATAIATNVEAWAKRKRAEVQCPNRRHGKRWWQWQLK